MKVFLNVDGGSRGNPGPAGAGVVIRDAAANAVIYEAALYIGKATNNVAEYSALVGGLKKALELGATSATIFSDSELLIRQMTGLYRVKNPGLLPLYEEAKQLQASFQGCIFKHIPREQNSRADALANKAMDDRRSSQRKLQKLTTESTEGTEKKEGRIETSPNSPSSAQSPGKPGDAKSADRATLGLFAGASSTGQGGQNDEHAHRRPSNSVSSVVKSSCPHHLICCQYDIAWEDPEANIAKVARLLDGAAVPAGSLVVLPEMFSTGFSMNVAAVALGPQRTAEAFLADRARKYRATFIGGVVTAANGGHGRNQAVAFDADGKELARYTKLHPFSLAGEQNHYIPGNDMALFEWNGVPVAPMICYDLRFPEVFRRAVRRGAKLILVLANWPAERDLHWATMLRSRAIENLCYVAGINRVGKSPHNSYAGHTMVIGPRGETLAEAGGEECMLRADLDFAGLDRYRAEFPALNDIRPEFLG